MTDEGDTHLQEQEQEQKQYQRKHVNKLPSLGLESWSPGYHARRCFVTVIYCERKGEGRGMEGKNHHCRCEFAVFMLVGSSSFSEEHTYIQPCLHPYIFKG